MKKTVTVADQIELMLECDTELFQGNTKKAMSDANAKSSDQWKVPIGEVRVIPNFNVRVKNAKYFERVRRIANSMKKVGFKRDHPLSGFVALVDGKNVAYIHGGHTRWDALALANQELKAEGKPTIEEVPFIVAKAGTNMEDLNSDLVTGNEGERLSPYETAIVCKRKSTVFGRSVEEIADEFDFSVQYVTDLLMLISSPKFIRDLVERDELAPTVAIELLHKHGDKTVEVLKRAQENTKAAGKTKITGKFVPGAILKKFVNKAAPAMVVVIKDINSDPGFEKLLPETKAKLADLMAKLEAAEKEEGGLLNDAAGNDAATSDESEAA